MVHQAWEKSRACADALRARYILLHCPASFSPSPKNLKQMRRFFLKIDRGKLKLLWEPRGAWAPELIKALCDDLGLIHAADPFVSPIVSEELLYLRLHGGKGFKHVYTGAELEWLRDLASARTPAYVMFNNMAMLDDALRFKALLAEKGGVGLKNLIRAACRRG